MKKLVCLLILAVPFMVMAQEKAEHEYVGVAKCKTCHRKPDQGEQFKIWQNSAHSKAYETLKSEESQKIAKEKGLKVAAHEAEECLACHATAYNVKAELIGKKFDIADGVQCETCHGPGSDYRKKKVMQDRQASIDAGMTPIFVKDGSAEKQCLECHNEKSPTYKEFNFEEKWKEIAHPVPAEE